MEQNAPADRAVSELVDKHGGRIYALGLRFCGNEDEAKDLVQDTFLLAFRKWDQFEGRSEPTTWLYRIAARACQRRRRRRVGEPRSMEPLEKLLPSGEPQIVDIPSSEESPLEILEQRETREAVERAIAALPERFRLPLVLKEIMELPVENVARILGVKESTIKTRLHRARLQIAKELRTTLPKKPASPPDHSKRMCLDLLKAKQESLDRGVAFPIPRDELCTRCQSLFATLDLEGEVCRRIGSDDQLPEEVRAEIARRFTEVGNGEG